jgi:hypothetical protein
MDKYGQACCHAVMKLSDYAQGLGVRDETAWRWWRAGQLDAS